MSPVEDINVRPADNGGFTVSFTEVSAKENKDGMKDRSHKSEVFESEEAATGRMKDLMKVAGKAPKPASQSFRGDRPERKGGRFKHK